MKFTHFAAIVIGLLPILPVQADVYRYVDERGNQVFTDAPREGAQKVQTGPVMTVPFPKATPSPVASPGASAGSAAKKPAAEAYVVTLLGPKADEVYRRGGDDIPVAVSVNPALAEGHKLVVLLNGVEWKDTVLRFDGSLDRGTHTLEARVLDGQGVVMASSKISFHVKQHSTLAPTAPKPKPKS